MGLFLAPKDLEFPLELGMKSNKSVCLCLLFVLHLPLFRGPTLPLLAARQPGRSGSHHLEASSSGSDSMIRLMLFSAL